MLMGLVLVGELLVYQEDFYTYRDQLCHLFGLIIEYIPYEDNFAHSIFIDLMHDTELWAQRSPDH